MTEANDPRALKDRFDAFSRRLDKRVREFKERGAFAGIDDALVSALEDRRELMRRKLRSAAHAGETWHVLQFELQRDLLVLEQRLDRWDRRLDAQTRKREGNKRSA